MTRFKNGQVPKSELVQRGVFWLPAGTWAKWDRLVEIVKKRHRVTLYITSNKDRPGAGAYRDLAMQKEEKAEYGPKAAAVGASSHGLTFKGKDAAAIDVSNYAAIPRAAFFAAAREAGFEPNYYDGRPGRPLEPWHLIDWTPWEDDMPSAEEVANAVWNKDMLAYNADKEWGSPAESTGRRLRRAADRSGRALIVARRTDAKADATLAALDALTAAIGASDPGDLTRIVEEAVARKLGEFDLSVTFEPKDDDGGDI